MNYKLSAAARAKIAEIYHYSVRTFGAARAKTYVEGLQEVFALLAERPQMGGKWRRWRRHEHAEHVIFYLEGEGGIRVVQIFHHRENIVAKMKR